MGNTIRFSRIGLLAALVLALPALPLAGRDAIDREISTAFAPIVSGRQLAAAGAELSLEEAILVSDSERRMAFVPVAYTPRIREGLSAFANGQRSQVIIGGFYVSSTSRWNSPPPGAYLLRLEGSSQGASVAFLDARGSVALTVRAEVLRTPQPTGALRATTRAETLQTNFGFQYTAAAPGDDARPQRCWKAEVSFLGIKIAFESHPVAADVPDA